MFFFLVLKVFFGEFLFRFVFPFSFKKVSLGGTVFSYESFLMFDRVFHVFALLLGVKFQEVWEILVGCFNDTC